MKGIKKGIIIMCLTLILMLSASAVVFAGDEFDPRGCIMAQNPSR